MSKVRFDRPGEAAEDRRSQLEQRQPLTGDVLALVDEELGRGRRELDLHAEAVGPLHDVEDGSLVQVPLREEQLVGLDGADHPLDGGEVVREELHAPGSRATRDRADDLDRDPATRRVQLPDEVRKGLALADQHDPSSHPDALHDLERGRRVRRPERPDRKRAGDDGGRDQPGGRELVVGAEPEGEHDQRDEDEGADDAAGAGPTLTRGVQPGLEEHEHRDRREERQPLARAGVPEQRPVDRVAVHGRAQDEREVDPERQPGDVHHRKGSDAGRTPKEPHPWGPAQEVRARTADVGGRALARPGRRGRLALCRGRLGRHALIVLPWHPGLTPRDRRPGDTGRARRRRHELVRRASAVAGGRRARAAPPRRAPGGDGRRDRCRGSTRARAQAAGGGAPLGTHPPRCGSSAARRGRPRRESVHERRTRKLGPGRILREIPGPGRPRRAVRVAEARAGCRDGEVGVPASATEERRQDPPFAEPGALPGDALTWVVRTRRTRVRRARPVRVMAERRPGHRLSRALDPEVGVHLARLWVRGTHQRRDGEPTGASLLQRGEGCPDAVVERSFDVARRDDVPFGGRDRHRAMDTTPRGAWCGSRSGCPAAARARARARDDPRAVRREERSVRDDARRQRDVRVPAGDPLRLHAASLRLVPGGPLLALRPILARRGARAGAGGRRARRCSCWRSDGSSPRRGSG